MRFPNTAKLGLILLTILVALYAVAEARADQPPSSTTGNAPASPAPVGALPVTPATSTAPDGTPTATAPSATPSPVGSTPATSTPATPAPATSTPATPTPASPAPAAPTPATTPAVRPRCPVTLLPIRPPLVPLPLLPIRRPPPRPRPRPVRRAIPLRRPIPPRRLIPLRRRRLPWPRVQHPDSGGPFSAGDSTGSSSHFTEPNTGSGPGRVQHDADDRPDPDLRLHLQLPGREPGSAGNADRDQSGDGGVLRTAGDPARNAGPGYSFATDRHDHPDTDRLPRAVLRHDDDQHVAGAGRPANHRGAQLARAADGVDEHPAVARARPDGHRPGQLPGADRRAGARHPSTGRDTNEHDDPAHRSVERRAADPERRHRAADLAAPVRLPLLLHRHPAGPASPAGDHHDPGSRRPAWIVDTVAIVDIVGDGRDWGREPGDLAAADRLYRVVLRRDAGARRHEPDDGHRDNARSTWHRARAFAATRWDERRSGAGAHARECAGRSGVGAGNRGSPFSDHSVVTVHCLVVTVYRPSRDRPSRPPADGSRGLWTRSRQFTSLGFDARVAGDLVRRAAERAPCPRRPRGPSVVGPPASPSVVGPSAVSAPPAFAPRAGRRSAGLDRANRGGRRRARSRSPDPDRDPRTRGRRGALGAGPRPSRRTRTLKNRPNRRMVRLA